MPIVVLWLFFFLHVHSQKLLLLITDCVGSDDLEEVWMEEGFRSFEDGVRCSDVRPVFPALPFPSRHAVLTGISRGRFAPEDLLDWYTDRWDRQWWDDEMIFERATREYANVALFFFSECNHEWWNRPSICISPKGSLADEEDKILQSTRTHDIVAVHLPNGSSRLAAIGHLLARSSREVRRRVDLSVVLLSLHGKISVPKKNLRLLENYVNMQLINRTTGGGAIVAVAPTPGKTHQLYNLLKSRPIPNVTVHYTSLKGDHPDWLATRWPSSELLLVADPGFGLISRDARHSPPLPPLLPSSISGYSTSLPEMHGVFLAYGPSFRQRVQRHSMDLTDVHTIICYILKLHCDVPVEKLTSVEKVLAPSLAYFTTTSITSLLYLFCLLYTF